MGDHRMNEKKVHEALRELRRNSLRDYLHVLETDLWAAQECGVTTDILATHRKIEFIMAELMRARF